MHAAQKRGEYQYAAETPASAFNLPHAGQHCYLLWHVGCVPVGCERPMQHPLQFSDYGISIGDTSVCYGLDTVRVHVPYLPKLFGHFLLTRAR